MKTFIKVGLALLAGLGAGGYVGYKFAEAKLSNEFSVKMNEDLEAVRNSYECRLAEMRNSQKAMASKLNAAVEKISEESLKSHVKQDVISETTPTKDVVDYTSFYNASNKVEKKKEEKAVTKPTYEIISDRQYDEGMDFDKLELRYYTETNTLVSDDDNMEVDMMETIGQSSISHFGEFEEDVLYVRNNYTKTDYCVYKEYGSFPGVRR